MQRAQMTGGLTDMAGLTDMVSLSHQFQVKIDKGVYDLGSWSKVSGLSMNWAPCVYRGGEMPDGQVMMVPGNSKHGTIKLSRAVCRDSSKVQEWVSSTASRHEALSGEISLVNFLGLNTVTWKLNEFYPIGWTVDTLAADTSKPIIETLELAHSGITADESLLNKLPNLSIPTLSMPGFGLKPKPPYDVRPNFGVAMRFQVEIEAGMVGQPLGRWATCSGLGMQVKLDEFQAGGEYASQVRSPGDVKYSQVTLERAITRHDSEDVNSWLRDVEQWITGDRAKASRAVRITMLSAVDWKPIYTWKLQDAIPVQWSGPSLSAKGTEVATEKLVLSYDGLEGGPGLGNVRSLTPSTAKRRATGQLTIKRKQQPGGTLTVPGLVSNELKFDYLPQRMQVDVQRQVAGVTGQVLADGAHASLIASGSVAVTFSDMRIEGVAKVANATKLLTEWMGTPNDQGSGGIAGTADKTQVDRKVPLLLTMGKTTTFLSSRDVHLASMNLTYTRFSHTGDPSRATVTLKFQCYDPTQQKQNPTSGTPEPGKLHQLVAGDSLARLATTNYGFPSAWRRIAENNGIDDPLRVRNGSRVMVPESS